MKNVLMFAAAAAETSFPRTSVPAPYLKIVPASESGASRTRVTPPATVTGAPAGSASAAEPDSVTTPGVVQSRPAAAAAPSTTMVCPSARAKLTRSSDVGTASPFQFAAVFHAPPVVPHQTARSVGCSTVTVPEPNCTVPVRSTPSTKSRPTLKSTPSARTSDDSDASDT